VADVKIDVWTESKIREERLGGVLAVSSGSAEPARVVIATYHPANATTHYALIGKGVTFDSGGLAIKPLPGMYDMKTDMSGAAVVSGVLAAVSALKLPIRLTVIAPLVENMSGDRAVKPSDVITSRSGVTIEVANPDAEGRLILAEGMTLALEHDPDAMIDVATLTGGGARLMFGQLNLRLDRGQPRSAPPASMFRSGPRPPPRRATHSDRTCGLTPATERAAFVFRAYSAALATRARSASSKLSIRLAVANGDFVNRARRL
jgi:hypothetical protein